MKRLLLILLVLPLVSAYTISEYTGGDVYVPPGKEVNLYLPFPEGNDCLPVAVLWVSGGKDYPRLVINGKMFEGSGLHRTVLEGNAVTISLTSSLPATLEGNSMIYCTKDPFIFVSYYPPSPILVGTYNYMDVVVKNYGFSPAEINVLWGFHPDLSPFYPVRTTLKVPARKKGTAYAFASLSTFLVSAPFVMKLSSHPRICISYRDSVMRVIDCDGPVPTEPLLKPRLVCVNGLCYNTSNLKIELNGQLLMPGDALSRHELDEFSEYNFDITEITFTRENEALEAQNSMFAGVLILIGLVFAGILSVVFK